MSIVSKELRCESKIPLDEFQYQEIDSILMQLGVWPVRTHEDRVVNSIYFDNINYGDYFENISGISKRKKVRLRWYNDNVNDLRLEIKNKNNKLSEKEIYQINSELSGFPETLTNLDSIIDDSLRDDARLICLDARFPVLAVRYKRNYYEVAPDLRMTIDRDIAYRSLYPSNQSHWVSSPVFAVIEFKYPQRLKIKLNTILNNFPYRLFRHSKYVIGMDVVHNG